MASYTETLKRVMDGDFEDATDAERDSAVQDVIRVCSVAAGAIAFQPIPLLDFALISPIQIGMVQAIGRVRGYGRLDERTILEMLSTFGASIVAQNAIMAAASFVPLLGWVIKISMAYALTWAIGEVSDHYFKTGRGATPEELRGMFKRVYKEKKAEKESSNKRNSTLKERLEQLKEAYADGLLTEEEFQRKKEEMLSDF
jgi:uncharacterized protein (DUF697 family)